MFPTRRPSRTRQERDEQQFELRSVREPCRAETRPACDLLQLLLDSVAIQEERVDVQLFLRQVSGLEDADLHDVPSDIQQHPPPREITNRGDTRFPTGKP